MGLEYQHYTTEKGNPTKYHQGLKPNHPTMEKGFKLQRPEIQQLKSQSQRGLRVETNILISIHGTDPS